MRRASRTPPARLSASSHGHGATIKVRRQRPDCRPVVTVTARPLRFGGSAGTSGQQTTINHQKILGDAAFGQSHTARSKREWRYPLRTEHFDVQVPHGPHQRHAGDSGFRARPDMRGRGRVAGSVRTLCGRGCQPRRLAQGAGVLECWDNIGLYLASMSRIVSGEIWGAAVACRVCVRYPVCNVSADAACHG